MLWEVIDAELSTSKDARYICTSDENKDSPGTRVSVQYAEYIFPLVYPTYKMYVRLYTIYRPT